MRGRGGEVSENTIVKNAIVKNAIVKNFDARKSNRDFEDL